VRRKLEEGREAPARKTKVGRADGHADGRAQRRPGLRERRCQVHRGDLRPVGAVGQHDRLALEPGQRRDNRFGGQLAVEDAPGTSGRDPRV
jgi:hypothetical protein